MTLALCWPGMQGDKPVGQTSSVPLLLPIPAANQLLLALIQREKYLVAPCAVSHPVQTPPETCTQWFPGKALVVKGSGKIQVFCSQHSSSSASQGGTKLWDPGTALELGKPALELGRSSASVCSPGLGQAGGAGRHSWVSLSWGHHVPTSTVPEEHLRD